MDEDLFETSHFIYRLTQDLLQREREWLEYCSSTNTYQVQLEQVPLFEFEKDKLKIIEKKGQIKMGEDVKVKELEKVDDRERTDFEVNDLVKIRSIESMIKNFGAISYDSKTPMVLHGWNPSMTKLCGEEAIVKDVRGDTIRIKFKREKELRKEGIQIDWTYSPDMLEIIAKHAESKTPKARKRKQTIDAALVQEMISKVDVKKMKKILSACFQMGASDMKGFDTVLREWAEAKVGLYKLFGKKFYLSEEVEYEADTSIMREKLDPLFKKFPVAYYFIDNSISYKDLATNELHGWPSMLDKYTPGSRGMKTSTYLSQVMNNKEFDLELSKVLEQTKVKGCIKISIDPIDYLLMSINKSGWQSCHSLYEGEGRQFGCYSAGVFSYMCDKVTAISYRHNKEEADFTINKQKFKAFSKNWRQCIYIDSDTGNFVTSRQYPGENEVVAKSVRELLEKQISKVKRFENKWVVCKESDTIKKHMRNHYLDIDDEYDDEDGELAYNDIWHGFSGKIVFRKDKGLDDTDIRVGSNPTCIVCGQEHLYNHNIPMCESCY